MYSRPRRGAGVPGPGGLRRPPASVKETQEHREVGHGLGFDSPGLHMAGPEKRLEYRIIAAIRARWPSSYVLKVHGSAYQQAGVPDLLVVVAGRLIGIEVKARRPGESIERLTSRVSLLQWGVIEDLRRAGAVSGAVFTVEDAESLVAAALDPSQDSSNIGLTRPN